jgi:hypothetical protein
LLGGDAFEALELSFDAFNDAVVPVEPTSGSRRNRRRSITDGVFSTPCVTGDPNNATETKGGQLGSQEGHGTTAADEGAASTGSTATPGTFETSGLIRRQCSLTVCIGPRFALAPTGYTLRSGSFYDRQMRNWCIEGSEHGDEEESASGSSSPEGSWTLLRRHIDDGALQAAKDRHTPAAALSSATPSKRVAAGRGAVQEAFLTGDTRELQHTWGLGGPTEGEDGAKEPRKFRYFRLRSDGPLIVRGFELHGGLFRA